MSAGSKIPRSIRTSFDLHSEEEQTFLKQRFDDRKFTIPEEISPEKRELIANKQAKQTAKLTKQRGEILSSLTYYESELNRINPASFPFLDVKQKASLRKQLLFTYSLLAFQEQIDTAEDRPHAYRSKHKSMLHCEELITHLDLAKDYDDEAPITYQKQLDEDIWLANGFLKFLGMTLIAPWIVDRIMELADNRSGAITNWLTDINYRRLYWVWGGSFLATILDMLPNDFYNIMEAKLNLDTVAPYTGYLSFILYYTRFGIHLGLLLKHTINGPWMSKAEAATPIWERFQTQWAQRKFALLNDSIWGFINMLCFFWLKGPGSLGYAGNVVTAILLIMDLALITWQFWEESTNHNAAMLKLERDKEDLVEKMLVAALEYYQKNNKQNAALLLLQEELKSDQDAQSKQAAINQLMHLIQATDDQQLADLRSQWDNLNKMQKSAEFDWKYKRYGLINNWVYALGLLIAFVIMCSFPFPPAALAPATVMILGVVGAALCFVLTAVNAAISGAIDIAKSVRSRKEVRAEAEKLLDAFKGTTDENLKRQLYLEMKQLMDESEYHRRMVHFHAMKLVRSVLIDAFVPAVIFISLMFMPLGIGLGIMAAGLALAMVSHLLISRFEPKPELLPDFNKEAYEAFADNPQLEDLTATKSTRVSEKSDRFFQKPSKDYKSLTLDDTDLENDGFYELSSN